MKQLDLNLVSLHQVQTETEGCQEESRQQRRQLVRSRHWRQLEKWAPMWRTGVERMQTGESVFPNEATLTERLVLFLLWSEF